MAKLNSLTTKCVIVKNSILTSKAVSCLKKNIDCHLFQWKLFVICLVNVAETFNISSLQTNDDKCAKCML